MTEQLGGGSVAGHSIATAWTFLGGRGYGDRRHCPECMDWLEAGLVLRHDISNRVSTNHSLKPLRWTGSAAGKAVCDHVATHFLIGSKLHRHRLCSFALHCLCTCLEPFHWPRAVLISLQEARGLWLRLSCPTTLENHGHRTFPPSYRLQRGSEVEGGGGVTTRVGFWYGAFFPAA